ncbi:MAG: hypothetical protein K1X74_09095 [Pirellulales bacterium]|nr:hypothetical protein [Pirellulales bacterium]
MSRRSRWMAWCCLLAVSGCGKAPTAWQPFESSEWGFSAEFPGPPTAETGGGPARPRDVGDMFTVRFSAPETYQTYEIAVYVSTSDREPLLARLQDYYGSGGDATPGSSGKLGEHSWSESKYVRGNEAKQVRYLVVGNRGYVLLVRYLLDKAPSNEEVSKFFNSFQLIGG